MQSASILFSALTFDQLSSIEAPCRITSCRVALTPEYRALGFPPLLHFFLFLFSTKKTTEKARKGRHFDVLIFFSHYAKRITNFETYIRDDEIVAVFGCAILYFNIRNIRSTVIHLTLTICNTNRHYGITLRRENPFGEEQLFLNNTEVLYASHFNESRPTKFIVHGFSDTGNEGWIRDLIGGGSTWILRRNLRIFYTAAITTTTFANNQGQPISVNTESTTLSVQESAR